MTSSDSPPAVAVFTPAELDYLSSQRLGRLATVGPDGTPQNSPVGFRVDPQTGTIEIGGRNLARSRKYANIKRHGRVSFVVDDLASIRPWTPRGIEIRGSAEAVEGHTPAGLPGHFSAEAILVHPERILSWGVDPQVRGMQRRTVRRSAG